MALSQQTVLKLYHTVIDDVIAGVRDPFLDEGVDEQVLQELKQVWTTKLMASKAVDATPDPTEQPVPPPALTNNPKTSSKSTSKTKASRAAAAAAASNNAENSNKSNIGNTTASSTSLPPPPAAVIGLDPNKIVPIQITLPPMPGVMNSEARVLTISVPASALQENQLHQVITGPIITSIMPLPPHIASSVLQQHVNSALQNPNLLQKQMDGVADELCENEDISCDDNTTDLNITNVPTIFAPISLDINPSKEIRLSTFETDERSKIISGPTGPSQTINDSIMASILQNLSSSRQNHNLLPIQVDGAADTSDEDGSDISEDHLDNDDDNINPSDEENEGEGAEEEPLNSGDDVSDEDSSELFETENVVVCQYDKITRSRNKWKFYLKDGIMNIGGKDYVFQKSNGDAEW